MNPGRKTRFYAAALLLLCAPPIVAAEPPVAAAKKAPVPLIVAAVVDDQPLYVGEVDAELQLTTRDQSFSPEERKLLRAQTLALLIDRVLVLKHLEQAQQGAAAADARLAYEQFSKQLQKTGRTVADFAREAGVDEAAVKRQFAWKAGWKRHLARHLTDENLARFFEKHRRDFDGTRILAAHILWKVEPIADKEAGKDAGQDAIAQATAAAVARARQVREEIVAGKMTFAAAAATHSAAPTKTSGGQIGLIQRHEPMPPAFSRAAFALEKGQISEPVVTAFGVHLIQCVEVTPGTTAWQDIRAEIENAAAEYLFSWIAAQQRPTARVRFTGELPHFELGTQAFAR